MSTTNDASNEAPVHVHDFQPHCGMPSWTICACGVYGPETQALLNAAATPASAEEVADQMVSEHFGLEEGWEQELEAAAPVAPRPIELGAESVRAELEEAAALHGITEAGAEKLRALEDHVIEQALRSAADETLFWDAYDSARRRAIFRLGRTHLSDEDLS